jgi:hypothetical protein
VALLDRKSADPSEGDPTGPLAWAQQHPVAIVIAGAVGIVSGLWSNTFSDYSTWEAFATGWGMFGLSLWVAKEILSW